MLIYIFSAWLCIYVGTWRLIKKSHLAFQNTVSNPQGASFFFLGLFIFWQVESKKLSHPILSQQLPILSKFPLYVLCKCTKVKTFSFLMETLMAKWQAFVTKCHTYFLTKVGFLTLPASEMFTEDPPSIHQLGKKGTLETTMPMIFFFRLYVKPKWMEILNRCWKYTHELIATLLKKEAVVFVEAR